MSIVASSAIGWHQLKGMSSAKSTSYDPAQFQSSIEELAPLPAQQTASKTRLNETLPITNTGAPKNVQQASSDIALAFAATPRRTKPIREAGDRENSALTIRFGPTVSAATTTDPTAAAAVDPRPDSTIPLHPMPVSPGTVPPLSNAEERADEERATVATTDGRAKRPQLRTVSVQVKSGDSLYSILRRQGISDKVVPALLADRDYGKRLKRIHPGQSLDLHLSETGVLRQMDYLVDETTTVTFVHDGTGYDSALKVIPYERKKSQVSGSIQSSLFLDGQRVGLSDRVIMQMSEVFGWDVDFALDLRRGDQFTIVYEELFLDGKKIRDGDILAAEFINKGNVYRAVRFVNEDGQARYYTPEGMSMRKAFLRTPVKFARISSRFNLRRKHPILHKFRAHRGVDYAARSGTPIKATGYGRIEFIGRKGDYGKTIVIRHGGGYTTLYAHLKNFRRGLKQGSSVKQGQVIGYVGKTGLATGPHLHYEFRVHGRHKDPLKVKLPKSLPIETKLLRQFREQTHKLVAMLDVYSPRTSVAMR
ncbi:MAG: peptidoglycan DD-metalloendopeptidase family protein [Gammaproteobacteria bacterium]|nr:peptidoglycan DD-metalloendopeptidase family protein [Gammaproteobacteria bacterium]